VNERPYLSIGEVLGLLLEEFPDVTISKIRFLESQGLIEPERTSSGYRKFYDADIERLRVILREQKENYLPLRVIRDRLETGEIDDSGSLPVPRGLRHVAQLADDSDPTDGVVLDDPTGTVARNAATIVTHRHPAAQARPLSAVQTPVHPAPRAADPEPRVYVRPELCTQAGLTAQQLSELESFGLVAGQGTGSGATYSDADLRVAKVAAAFLRQGIEARHLRAWRQSAEREMALIEQRVAPLLRQRNPRAHSEASASADELAALGAQLRAALMASMMQHFLDR
jgi:DNA-binding transcriptional MerR regulator